MNELRRAFNKWCKENNSHKPFISGWDNVVTSNRVFIIETLTNGRVESPFDETSWELVNGEIIIK